VPDDRAVRQPPVALVACIRRSELDCCDRSFRPWRRGGLSSWVRQSAWTRAIRAVEHTMDVFAFSTSRAAEWRWRIIDLQGETLEESSARFPTMAEALAAGTRQLQSRRDCERQPPAQAPWQRGF
jgi:hypothetical protein